MCMLSCFSRVWLFGTLWTVACQVPLSMRFSRQEYWSDLPCPPPGDLPDPGIEPAPPALQANSLPLSHRGSLLIYICVCLQCGRSPGEGATHSSRPGKFHGLYSPWGRKESDTTEWLWLHFMYRDQANVLTCESM